MIEGAGAVVASKNKNGIILLINSNTKNRSFLNHTCSVLNLTDRPVIFPIQLLLLFINLTANYKDFEVTTDNCSTVLGDSPVNLLDIPIILINIINL